MIIYLLISLFAGFMSGMFGIGGGTVRIPLLNLAGLPLLSAFGINFLVIPFASFVGAVTQRRNIAKRYNISIRKAKGSHVVLEHDSWIELLTIPAHRPIKPIYIKKLTKLIEDLRQINDEKL